MRVDGTPSNLIHCLPSLALAALTGACGGGSDPAPAPGPPPVMPPPVLGPALAGTGALQFLAAGAVVAQWNSTPEPELESPGMKVQFFGAATGCPDATNGPADMGPDAVFAQSADQVGLAAAAAAQRWTPIASAALCADGSPDLGGPPYVMADTQADSGGIAFYTQAGFPSGTPAPFFGPYGAGGQDGGGNNGFIVGTFVSFQQDWQDAGALQPFTGGAVQVHAPITITRLDPGGMAGLTTVVQVKEQFRVSFVNPSCIAAGLGAAHHCQVQYQFPVAISRPNVSDWSTQSWFVPDVLFDPGQGGVPVIDCPLPAAGADGRDRQTGLSLFTSLGAPSQHAAAPLQDYAAQITFAQLENALRAIEARGGDGSDAAVAASWGAQWNDPTAWVLLATGVGQEVFDPLADHVATIGALLHDITITPTHTP